jgi:murein DD-endopeptidase MepM/ murein hydrolase activator NlpD
MQLAQLYGTSGAPASDQPQGQAQQPAADNVAISLDQLQAQVEEASAAVTKANDAYQAALLKANDAAVREQALNDLAEQAPLLSDRLDAQQQAVQVGVEADAAQAEVDRLRGELEAAQATLTQLQDEVQAASFNQPARQILSAAPVATAAAAANYVFPVGGGPSVVSVSHSHHDYPAADIAAPEGSPVYALSDGTVLYSWPDDERCGTGFTIRTTDGQTWTYCHLSYLYPSVVQGAQLHAGDPVGLVGETGHATGPHLHLQLQPATSYPQDQAWFESFAGTAYRWQDEPPTAAGASAAPKVVFDIVQPSD